MRVRILGPLEVENDSGEAIELGPPKQRALLALLAIHPNSVLSTERIIDDLWGDELPTDGPRNVRVYISRLREVLEPGRIKRAPGRLIVTESSGYSLRIDPERIDAHQFERLIGEARSRMVDEPESARETIEEALSLWRDLPLAGLALEEFAQSEIRRLTELHLSALELRLEASLRVGEPNLIIPELEKLVAEHPLRERFVALLMEALADTGRQSEALRTYRSLELRLADEMGLAPSSELRNLEEQILLQQNESSETPQPPDSARSKSNLPIRLTSLVGREDALKEVTALLRGVRLLTTTGPGGVGKTSLTIEVARAATPEYPGGIWLADLSPLQDSSRVLATIAEALGVEGESGVPLQSTVVAALGRQRSLLLLDNCEHLVDAVSSIVEDLLHAVPQLTIACTSRRLLGIDGESVYEVAPLELPSVGATVDGLQGTASSRLLSERATAVAPGFAITAENAADVAALCRRLDGIPLAIELAASNLRSMTTHEIVESLANHLALRGRQSGIPHHRTLRATMQWSYDLLGGAEQELFDQLSGFAGRFSREAAVAIGAGRDPSAELAALIDASLIVADVSGQAASYRVLPTLRDFGLFNLRESGKLEAVRRNHAEYLAADAADMGLPLAPIGATKRIEQNASVEDFRVAAEWALQVGAAELAVSLLVPLSHYSISGGHVTEAERWLAKIEELDIEDSLNLWRLRLAAAMDDWYAGRNEQAEQAFRSLSATAREWGEAEASADALQFAGYVRMRSGDLRGARDDMATAAEAVSDWVGRGHTAREALVFLEVSLGDIAAAEVQADVLASYADRTGDRVALCDALNARGWVSYYQDDLEASVQAFEQCRDIAIEEGDWPHDVNARLCLAWVFPSLGRPDLALVQAEGARDLSTGARNPSKRGDATLAIGGAQLDLGRLHAAAGFVAAGLEIVRDTIRNLDTMMRGLRIAGWTALADGRNDLAVRFVTVEHEQRRQIHYVAPPAHVARSARALAVAAESLGDAERDGVTRAAGSAPFAMVLNEAVDYLKDVAEGRS